MSYLIKYLNINYKHVETLYFTNGRGLKKKKKELERDGHKVYKTYSEHPVLVRCTNTYNRDIYLKDGRAAYLLVACQPID